jgi:hypothetical protein
MEVGLGAGGVAVVPQRAGKGAAQRRGWERGSGWSTTAWRGGGSTAIGWGEQGEQWLLPNVLARDWRKVEVGTPSL